MCEDERDPFDLLRREYEGGNPQALLDALRLALSREPNAGWARGAVQDAMLRWNNGETREFGEPWGLIRPKGWQQQPQMRQTALRPELGLSLRGAVLRRIAKLLEEGVPRLADEHGGVFPMVAEEFSRYGVSSALARKWWYSAANLLRRHDSQEVPDT